MRVPVKFSGLLGCGVRQDGARILQRIVSVYFKQQLTRLRICMNKGEFVEALADRLDVPRAQAERALGGVLEIIAEQLAEGDKIAFTGFGSFEVSKRAARTGRNPRTGDTIKIAASSVPKFTAGATLKAAVNK
jgi:DNA-binding protein HU-beta